MKKFIIPVMLIGALLMTSCGKGSEKNKPSVSGAPSPINRTVTETAKPEPSSELPGQSAQDKTAEKEPSGENELDEGIGEEARTEEENGDSAEVDSVSIINGSSIPFYAVYLSTSSDGNPGENIIGDTPLGEGEEVVLPFANAPEKITVIAEDENGIQYSAEGVSLANGMTIELRLNGSTLEAVVQ